MRQTTARPVDLILDEMFSPKIAEILRNRGRQVIAVAERIDLRAMTDENLFVWCAAQRCWLLTENVKDFRPLALRALQAGTAAPGLLFTNSRTFIRSRKNPGPLVDALDTWLLTGPPPPPQMEDWLPATDG